MDRRRFLRAAGGAALATAAGCADRTAVGGTATATGSETMTDDTTLALESPAFDDGGTIPGEFTCAGADASPELRVGGVPDGAAALALVVDDPDAPGGTPFVHWLVWNVPPDVSAFPRDLPATPRLDALDGAAQGTNGFGKVGYRGPCPPMGDGPHTYRFTLYALDAELALDPGAKRPALEEAMEGHVLARTRLTAEFDR